MLITHVATDKENKIFKYCWTIFYCQGKIMKIHGYKYCWFILFTADKTWTIFQMLLIYFPDRKSLKSFDSQYINLKFIKYSLKFITSVIKVSWLEVWVPQMQEL